MSLPTTLFLCATQLGAVDGAACRRSTPTLAEVRDLVHHGCATCSIALDGMQPTLRQTPPSDLIALDENRPSGPRSAANGTRPSSRPGPAPRTSRSQVEVGLAGPGRGVRHRRRRLSAALARETGDAAFSACSHRKRRLRARPRLSAPGGRGLGRRLALAVHLRSKPRQPTAITDALVDRCRRSLTFSSLTTPAHARTGSSIDALSLSIVISALLDLRRCRPASPTLR